MLNFGLGCPSPLKTGWSRYAYGDAMEHLNEYNPYSPNLNEFKDKFMEINICLSCNNITL